MNVQKLTELMTPMLCLILNFYYLSVVLLSTEVLFATQNKTVNAETNEGKIPYKVSVTLCDCLSTATKTVIQNATVSSNKIAPTIETGTKINPAFLNQLEFFITNKF